MDDDILNRIDEAAEEQDRQESFAGLASVIGDYYRALRAEGLPQGLLYLLVQDYHMIVLEQNG